MKKMIKSGVLLVISMATVLAPLDTALADIQLSYGGDIITRTMRDTERSIDNQMKSVQRSIDDQMKSVQRSIDDQMKSVQRSIDDQMKSAQRSMDANFSSGFNSFHSSYNHPRNHVDHRRREQKNHHVEHKTFHYVERKKTTHHHIHEHHVNHNNSGDALAVGILGLATGTILGTIFKKPEQPQVVYQIVPQNQVIYQEVPQNQRVYQVQQTIEYEPLQQPSVSNWLNYCKKKYRSFNPKTGTFRDRNGLEHFCYAPIN